MVFFLTYRDLFSLVWDDRIITESRHLCWTPYGFFIGSARISVTTFMRWLKNGLESKLKCEENPICIIKGLHRCWKLVGKGLIFQLKLKLIQFIWEWHYLLKMLKWDFFDFFKTQFLYLDLWFGSSPRLCAVSCRC